MSHGGSSEYVEPNLTPLLDLVLQILMFFIICANFVEEQFSGDILLPVASSARPIDASEVDVLFLNVNPDGNVSAVGREYPMELAETKYYLKTYYEDQQRLAKDGEVRTAVVLRADGRVNYVRVYDLLRICKDQGFRRLRLRASIRNQ